MKLEGERKLPGKPERVWELLQDPDVLVSAIPGCERLEKKSEDHYTGVIEAKVGSIESKYNASFKLHDKNPPQSYRLKVQGQGSAGFVNGDVLMELSEADGGTRIRWDGDAQVGGRIAQIGQRMVQATATTMTDKGFNNLRERIQQEVSQDEGSTVEAPKEKGALDRIREFFRSVGTFLKAFFKKPAAE